MCQLPQAGFKIEVEGRIEAQVKSGWLLNKGGWVLVKQVPNTHWRTVQLGQLPEIPLTELCVELIIRKL